VHTITIERFPWDTERELILENVYSLDDLNHFVSNAVIGYIYTTDDTILAGDVHVIATKVSL